MKWTAAILVGLAACTGALAADATQPDSSFITFNGTYPVQRFLFPGQAIESPLCRFRTVFQSDGNLVTYDNQDHPIWWMNHGASLPSDAYAAMQLDGNLVVYASGDQPFWATNTARWAGSGRLVQQDDGNLVLYNSAGTYMWASFPSPITYFSGPCHNPKHTDIAWGFTANGGDFSAFWVPDNKASVCGSACAANSTCKAWTWVPPWVSGITGAQSACYLKSSQPAMTARTGFVSGRIITGSS